MTCPEPPTARGTCTRDKSYEPHEPPGPPAGPLEAGGPPGPPGPRLPGAAARTATPATAAVLEQVLDEDWLSGCTGWDVRACRLRVKPEVSLLIGLEERHTGHAAGWARILWPVSASKERKTRRLLSREGRELTTRDLGSGLVMLLGRPEADPWLVTHVTRARRRGLVPYWGPHQVLRYNPGRRLVLRQEGAVVRIRAGSADKGRFLDRLHRAIGSLVPAPALLGPPDPQEAHISVQQRCGSTDLAASASLEGTRRAGALLAALHEGAARIPGSVRSGLRPGPDDPERVARTHAGILEALAPDLAARVRAVGAALPDALPGSRVLAHGDASPDQFLDDPPTARTWITDFDRVCLAPAATDLGSYLAVAPEDHRGALLEGYASAGGSLPPSADLETAVALSRLSRLADPLRHADPGWRRSVADNLARLEEDGPWHR